MEMISEHRKTQLAAVASKQRGFPSVSLENLVFTLAVGRNSKNRYILDQLHVNKNMIYDRQLNSQCFRSAIS